MTSICIAILTYRRPEGLSDLLTHLIDQAASVSGPDVELHVLVVDNDPEGTAADTLAAWRRTHDPDATLLTVRLVHETEPGIAAARNRALLESAESDLLVFIDDDETPSPAWLSTLLNTWRSTGADAVAGPVRPVYETRVAGWIRFGPFHDAPDLPDGATMSHAASGNLLLDRRTVARIGATFPRIGTRGGEDSHFTHALTDAGAVIRWCADAVVTERVPAPRATASWVTRRSFGNGLSWAGILTERERGLGGPSSTPRRVATTALGAARVAAGVATVAHGVVTRSAGRTGLGIHRAARGAGVMAGAWGWIYDEYARPGMSRWRRESASR